MRPGARALILTDNAQVAGQFMEAVQHARIAWVSFAESIDDALRHCAFGGHSLAVIDRDLGLADGLDFVRAVRVTQDHPSFRMPVILVSTRTAPTDIAEAEALGVTVHLPKPISVAILSQKIVQVFVGDIVPPD